MPICIEKGCGRNFKWFKWNRSAKRCPECSEAYGRAHQWNNIPGARLDAELKRDADLSGNPKIWTAAEFSQEFLMELIPK